MSQSVLDELIGDVIESGISYKIKKKPSHTELSLNYRRSRLEQDEELLKKVVLLVLASRDARFTVTREPEVMNLGSGAKNTFTVKNPRGSLDLKISREDEVKLDEEKKAWAAKQFGVQI